MNTAHHSSSTGNRGSKDLDALRQSMLRAIRRRCPRWLVEQSEDIVHEAMVRVLERMTTTHPDQQVGAGYWMRAAQNELIDEIRRRRASREVPLITETAAVPRPSRAPGPDRLYASREAGEAIFNCLQHLADPRKQAVTLYLHGHTAKDTGKLLHWPVRRVQNMVFRGLRDLRDCLNGQGVEQ